MTKIVQTVMLLYNCTYDFNLGLKTASNTVLRIATLTSTHLTLQGFFGSAGKQNVKKPPESYR